MHLALAESYGLDVFLTTDDRLLKTAKKINLKIKTMNPVTWLMEVKRSGQ
ncbi:MAG: type II toxin-antitoxin system VapC family toxin [Clostridiales bacterium]|nr:type II toxin-antitoxin system VapC family toxin [Clostridiales bacterium]